MVSLEGRGPQTDKHLPQSPFKGQDDLSIKTETLQGMRNMVWLFHGFFSTQQHCSVFDFIKTTTREVHWWCFFASSSKIIR
jgi:hypothetical protein